MVHKCHRFVSKMCNPEEWNRMVVYLGTTLPKEDLITVYKEIQNDPNWVYLRHHDYGMFIRNHLRNGGFRLNAIALDEIWADLLYQASILIHLSSENKEN